MSWSVFLIHNIAKFLREPILKNICERLLLKMCLWNWEKLKIIHKEFCLYITKTGFSNINIKSKWKCLFLLHDWFPMKFVFKYNISLIWRQISKKELIKRRSKVQEKIMSCERALNFDQRKTFSENYKPMRVWLWLVYKFAENQTSARLFSEFIQTQKRYPTSPDKIRILTWKLLVISS